MCVMLCFNGTTADELFFFKEKKICIVCHFVWCCISVKLPWLWNFVFSHGDAYLNKTDLKGY